MPPYEEMWPRNYLLALVLHNVALSAICWVLGKWVLLRNVKVNYTRKLNHVALFLIPMGLASLFPYPPNVWTITTSAVAFLATTSIFIKPIRDRVPAVATAFAGVDRPEDRPHTLAWIVTQAIAAYAALVAIYFGLDAYGAAGLIMIPLVVTAVGDGLAEPVGIRFGRHRYRVPSLVPGRRYVRTLEGSACVFVAGLVTVALCFDRLTAAQFTGLLVLVPTAMTIAEAVSPHSWDAPLLYLAGGGTICGVLAALPAPVG